MDIDLSKFDLEAAAVHPYLSVVPKGERFEVYEGAFGKRYQYFSIPTNSEAGRLCGEFYENYIVRNGHRFNYYEDGTKMLSAAKKEQSVYWVKGPDAYLKYWDSLADEEKRKTHFNVIPHFGALKEWFRLRCNHLAWNENSRLLTQVEMDALKKKQLDGLLKEIEVYLQPPVAPMKFSLLSMSHAYELHKFYKWIEQKRKRPRVLAYVFKTVSKLWSWIMNNPMVATILGGIIALLIGTWIMKLWHWVP